LVAAVVFRAFSWLYLVFSGKCGDEALNKLRKWCPESVMKQWCSLVVCPCTCTMSAAVMLCEIGGHGGSGAVMLCGYIHIFQANVLPRNSPSHNTCLSESLVTVLTKETTGYSETTVSISQRTWRHILEDKSGLVSGTVLNAAWSKVCGALCCYKTASLGEAALRGTGATEVTVYMQLYRLCYFILYTLIYI
jgi:hypothetical protein